MWATVGGVAMVTIILALAFRLAATKKKLGRSLERIQNLETGNSWLRAALGSHSAADPTLADLGGMYDTPADTVPAGQRDLSGSEQ
jgi:hypothetical protein